MLLRLAPGLRLVRRGTDHVQVGLLPDRRVLLDRSPTTAQVIRQVLAGAPLSLDEPGVAEVAERLVGAGCATPDGTAAPDGRNAAARVRVVETGGALRGDLHGRLRGAGLTPAETAEHTTLVVAHGEPARELFDPLVRGGRPHAVVRLVDGAAVVGPFVLPGVTACLRCLDAHAAEADPDHLSVLTRYVAASQEPRGDGEEDRPAPALVDLALALAVRDLLAYADGHRPLTWSATLQLGPETGGETRQAWRRHPECGCTWPGSMSPSGKLVG